MMQMPPFAVGTDGEVFSLRAYGNYGFMRRLAAVANYGLYTLKLTPLINGTQRRIVQRPAVLAARPEA